jgi:hypothetical protein
MRLDRRGLVGARPSSSRFAVPPRLPYFKDGRLSVQLGRAAELCPCLDYPIYRARQGCRVGVLTEAAGDENTPCRERE